MNLRHFKFLRNKSWFGKFLRLPVRLIPDNTVLNILSGILKGRKFIKGSHNISIFFGIYERKHSDEFATFCTSSKSFWDLGAHVGYYTLLYHVINPAGKISAFEPSGVNAKLFYRHMELNRIHNYKLFEVAVSDQEGMMSFNKTRTTVAGKLDEAGETKVKVERLSKLFEAGKIELPDLVKTDIEGAEESVLRDLKNLFTEKKPVLFVSTHGKEVHLNCVNMLKQMGYNLKPLDKSEISTSREILAYP